MKWFEGKRFSAATKREVEALFIEKKIVTLAINTSQTVANRDQFTGNGQC